MVFNQREAVDNIGLFVQGVYDVNDIWSLHAGIRYDEISYGVTDRYLANGDDSGTLDFDETSPSLAVNYRARSGVWFASYSSSFETPTTTELANPDASGGFNPLLSQQVADNFEIGYKHSVDDLYFELSAFTIDLEDELIPYELAAFQGRRFFANAGSSSRDGIEAAISRRIDTDRKVAASYT